ncbi:MAG: hypothetical protein AAFO81_14945 [Pseudomonadota bacterium]
MFKLIRITILSAILLFVALDAWLSQVRSTDWNDSLWVSVYPIHADASAGTREHIASLTDETFAAIETFFQRETQRYGGSLERPVRITLKPSIGEQPPTLADQPNVFEIMLWSLRMRWWTGSITKGLDDIRPDIRVFIRYHEPTGRLALENSIGVQRGMYSIVNAYTGRTNVQRNNVVIAHEMLHTIGATDKYDPGSNQPVAPDGLAEPAKSPLYPQRFAEIMGGRIATSPAEAVMPSSLGRVVIGEQTATEIGLLAR